MPKKETAPHEKHYYEAAQAAHEEFFVATNKPIDEAFQAFEKAYARNINCTSGKALLWRSLAWQQQLFLHSNQGFLHLPD